MLESSYRKRLARDLPRWREHGWVTADGATAILASVEDERPGMGLSAVIATLGAVLFGVGVIALVAANWELIPRLLRFGMLVGALAAAYAAAAVLHKRDAPAFAEAAMLIVGLIFAGAIALIGQSYHLGGEFADAVLLWAVGCLAAALFARSSAMTLLALVGSAYWTVLATSGLDAPPHWGGLALVLVGGAVALHVDSRMARASAVLALGFWVAVAITASALSYQWPAGGALALAAVAALALWSVGSALTSLDSRPRLEALGRDMLWPSLAALLLALAVLQLEPDLPKSTNGRGWLALSGAALAAAAAAAGFAGRRNRLGRTDVLAVLVIGVGSIAFALWPPPDGFAARLLGSGLVLLGALWAVSLGQSGRQPAGKVTGLVVFGAEVIYVYVVTFGTMLNTALALLGGGLLFILLAILLVRIDRHLAARATGGAA